MTDRPRFAPFAGIRYSAARVPDVSLVVAPPYDMISPHKQEELYARHSLNVIRLILNKEEEKDGPLDRYERAAATYRKWREIGVLVRDDEPSIYAYRQDYDWGGKAYSRLGFIARVALTEFGEGAFPHESTLSGPKADRLRLMTACRTNFSSIFSLFSDADGSIQSRLETETAVTPTMKFNDEDGIGHQFWRLSRPEFHRWINDQMRAKHFIIADGHHRYETALEYRRLARSGPEELRGDSDYVMMFLAPIESPGLTILPHHRLFTLPETEKIADRLREAFDIEEEALSPSTADSCSRIIRRLEEAPSDASVFVVCTGDKRFMVMTMKEDFDPGVHIRPGTAPLVAKLDVTVLDQVVIRGLLGLDEQRLVQDGNVAFLSRPEEALDQVRKGTGRAAFFLRPTRIEQVWKIAMSGQKMPQKSTNFYPKLKTGLVINEL